MSVPSIDQSNVRALHRPRVLVATRDRRYARIVSFLLARAGYDVDASGRPDELVEDVARFAPGVVVLDATGSLGETARAAAAVEATHPSLRVLFVTEDEQTNGSLPLFGKWSALERLVDEVGRAAVGLKAS
jgi:DNA-binding NtrC family response regulator